MDQLSNYELLDLYATYTSDGAGHFMNFLGVFSAYLVAGYFVAGKLGRTTLISLSALYTLVVGMTATGSYITMSSAFDIAKEVATRNISDATNLVATATMMSGIVGELTVLLNPIVQLLACVGSIAFVFSSSSKEGGATT